jgi:A/G-specific adenine glycosylase
MKRLSARSGMMSGSWAFSGGTGRWRSIRKISRGRISAVPSRGNRRKTLAETISREKTQRFRNTVLGFYRRHGRSVRDLPWRATRHPYRILVSEFMLQQTQVERVKPKYRLFLRRFPSLAALAHASFPAVLGVWQGLGYNRRARNLWLCAREIVERHRGRVPRTADELLALPGVGPSTAGAILSFAFNLPSVFIETNIRSVFIHYFFKDAVRVSDRELVPLVAATCPRDHAREWYFALFDYGVHLKQSGPDPARRSAQYKKQPPFKGSRREVRGGVLRLLAADPCGLSARVIAGRLGKEAALVRSVLAELGREGFLETRRGRYWIAGGQQRTKKAPA